jgi:hypothetical protein
VWLGDLQSMYLGSGDESWTELQGTFGVLTGAATGWDSKRSELLAFSGSADFLNGRLATGAWAMHDGGWRALDVATGTAPETRMGSASAYDPEGDQLLMFGGAGSKLDGDTWALGLGGAQPTWTLLDAGATAATATEPGPLYYPSGVWDAAGRRLLVYGGLRDWSWSAASLPRTDVWAFGAASRTWSLITPSGTPPPLRASPVIAFDSRTGSLIVVGGQDDRGDAIWDTWRFTITGSTGAWTELTPTGTAPTPRGQHTLVYDALHHRVLVYGGWDRTGDLDEVWALSLPPDAVAWKRLCPLGRHPLARSGHVAVATTDGMLAWGSSGSSLDLSPWLLAWNPPGCP